jgi:hypothetical protein
MEYESKKITAEQIAELEQYYNINLPNQSNSLYEEIREILYWSKRLIPEYGDTASRFGPPVSEDEITKWEESNGIIIPESYKEWLRFSCDSQIRNTLAHFSRPNDFEINNPSLPEDLVVIGWLIGDGEILCFSKNTGLLVRYFEGNCDETFKNFASILHQTIQMMNGEGLSKESEDLLLSMARENKEKDYTDGGKS